MLQTAINSNINGYCQYRLPCGYCEKLGRDCPKQGYNYTPTITNLATKVEEGRVQRGIEGTSAL